jgi:hypothetical protein
MQSASLLHGAGALRRPVLLPRKTQSFVGARLAHLRSKRSAVVVRADLLDSLAAAPLPALAAGAAVVLGVGGYAVWAALQQQQPAGSAEVAAEPAEPAIPREDAVLVFGSSGRMGRALTAKVSLCLEGLQSTPPRPAGLVCNCQTVSLGGPLLPLLLTATPLASPQLVKEGRTVVAAARNADRARGFFEKMGVTEGVQANGRGILFIDSGVDITKPETLTPELFKGVTQIISSVGAVFGRAADGTMG